VRPCLILLIFAMFAALPTDSPNNARFNTKKKASTEDGRKPKDCLNGKVLSNLLSLLVFIINMHHHQVRLTTWGGSLISFYSYII
jgi:hypothetical protein